MSMPMPPPQGDSSREEELPPSPTDMPIAVRNDTSNAMHNDASSRTCDDVSTVDAQGDQANDALSGDDVTNNVEDGESEDGEDDGGVREDDGEDADQRDGPNVTVCRPPRRKGKQRAKTVTEREATKGKKPGNAGNFHGEQFNFLSLLMEDFMAVRRSKRTGKKARWAEFCQAVRVSFWAKFNWSTFVQPSTSIPETQEEVMDCVNSVSERCILPQTKSELTFAARSASKSIKSWFGYQASKVTADDGKNPWATALSELRKPAEVVQVRKPTAYQLWAKDHYDEVKEAAGSGADIGTRNRVAKALYEEQSDEVKESLQALAMEQLESMKRDNSRSLNDLPSPPVAEQLE